MPVKKRPHKKRLSLRHKRRISEGQKARYSRMREALTLVERVERSLLSKISDQELEAGFREALKLDEMLSAEPTASKTEDADVPR